MKVLNSQIHVHPTGLASDVMSLDVAPAPKKHRHIFSKFVDST